MVIEVAVAAVVVTSQDRVGVDAGDIDQFQMKHHLLHTLATCRRALYRVISNRSSAVYQYVMLRAEVAMPLLLELDSCGNSWEHSSGLFQGNTIPKLFCK